MVDRDGLEQVRDQLWVEAVHRYKVATGNDSGACTRAQPCRTLQAAHNKTKGQR